MRNPLGIFSLLMNKPTHTEIRALLKKPDLLPKLRAKYPDMPSGYWRGLMQEPVNAQ